MAEQEENQQERTEQATPKRREEARKKGQVAKSIEVNSSAILLISLLFFFFAGSYMQNTMSQYSRIIFENFDTISVNPDNLPDYLALAGIAFLKIILPFVVVIMFIGLSINYLQVGFLFTLEPLKPKLSKINPLSGFKRVLFSRKALVELVKGILKIVIVGSIAYWSIKGQVKNYIPLIDQSAGQMILFTGQQTLMLGVRIALVLLVLALLDFLFQKYDYERSIRMTKQEVKEEYKQLEGDPHIKARIRSIQREMARRTMLEEVAEADVVITNPTHVAVALQYKPKDMEAPLVLAKGREKIAHKIKAIAEEHEVPVVEDPPLAWALFKSVNIGDTIPEDLFHAVAEVLAYVYKLKNKDLAN
ncbi:flagellar biosynthesis protein FlhB [candidate division KSB1 bacterium]